MARPKKADEQKQLAPAMQPHPQAAPLPQSVPVAVPVAAAPPPIMNHANRSIDVPNFIRVRDSVCPNPLLLDLVPPSPPPFSHHHPASTPAPVRVWYHHCTTTPRTSPSGSDVMPGGANAVTIVIQHYHHQHCAKLGQLVSVHIPHLHPLDPISISQHISSISPAAALPMKRKKEENAPPSSFYHLLDLIVLPSHFIFNLYLMHVISLQPCSAIMTFHFEPQRVPTRWWSGSQQPPC